MIESLVVIVTVLLLLLGLAELANAFASREILRHAASRASRARTVGFNEWMCRKVFNVAAIPVSGEMLCPDTADFRIPSAAELFRGKSGGEMWDMALEAAPQSDKSSLELGRIPDYLASENHARAGFILDYAGWDGMRVHGLDGAGDGDEILVKASMDGKKPLFMKMLADWLGSAYDGGRQFKIRGESRIENHYPLYLEGRGY